jgi:hypothetical protein
MKQRLLMTALLATLLVIFCPVAAAQAPAGQGQSSQEGIERGGYNIQQSIEFGYRFTDITTPHNGGNDPQMFNTMVNLHQGARLLEQTLSMRSLTHTGVLFDNFYVNSFGWGGDPNNAALLRVEKDKFYNLSLSFRRDQNYFNYDLLANPLRTAADSPLNPQVNFSPHSFEVRRRMADFDLTLLPQSAFTLRLGYNRNRAEGPSYSTYHEGVDVLLSAPWNTTYHTYRVGFDLKVLPKTNISFDQFLEYGKQDTNYFLQPFAQYKLNTAVDGVTTYEFGLPAATATCINATSTNYRNCSGYTSYNRLQKVRTTSPTSQLSFQSRPTEKVELIGRVSYSSTDMKSPFSENFTGLITRTHERALWMGGDIKGRIVAVSSDFGVTIHLTDKLSFSDTFRWVANRQPAFWDSTEGTVLILTAGQNTVTQCNPLPTTSTADCKVTPAGTPSDAYSNFLGTDSKWNTAQLEYNASKHFGARLGYRFGARKITEAAFEPAADSAAWDLREHTGLFGIWFRPNNDFRFNGEVELTSNGGNGLGPNAGFLTRLSPRQQQHYRFRSSYKPFSRATISMTANLLENRNGYTEIMYRGHNRNIGISASVAANDRLSFDASYNFGDFIQHNWICFVDSYASLPPGTLGPSTAANPTKGCPTWNSSANPTPYALFAKFQDTTNFFSGLVMFRPVKRVSGSAGYSMTKVGGLIPKFNAFQPVGPLKYTFHQPLASFSVELNKNWSFNTYWNYDQYAEKDFVGPTWPRYFHDNRATLAFRYAF